jgi:hypothetical protein
MSQDEKDIFVQESLQIRLAKKLYLRSLHPSLRQIYKLSTQKPKKTNKTCSVFMLYLKKRWKEEKHQLTYRKVVTLASQEWKALPDVEKDFYRKQAKEISQITKNGFQISEGSDSE